MTRLSRGRIRDPWEWKCVEEMKGRGMAEVPSLEEAQTWQKRLASQANNRAWTLAEQTTRTAADDAEMIDAAHAARHLWRQLGVESSCAHADMLLGHVHALTGHGRSAMTFASAAQAYFLGRDSAPWERAFAHAVLANAAYADRQVDLHRSEYAAAQAAAEALTDPEDRQLFNATFAVVPKPA